MNRVKKAITLVEIIVSAMLLASALAGIVATFVSTRRMVGRGTERVTAANLAREKLNGLYAAVRADEWNAATNDYINANDLNEGVTNTDNIVVDNITYSVSYDVQNSAMAIPGITPAENYKYKVANLTVDFIVPG